MNIDEINTEFAHISQEDREVLRKVQVSVYTPNRVSISVYAGRCQGRTAVLLEHDEVRKLILMLQTAIE